MNLKPEKRYLIYVNVQLDKEYFKKDWYAASYHTGGGKNSWFLIEHPSEFLRKNHEANFFNPSGCLAIKQMPRVPKL